MACLEVLDGDLVVGLLDGHGGCALSGGRDGTQALAGYRDDIMGGLTANQKQPESQEN